MAEIQIAANTHKKGGRPSKKFSTRVDLTPMVDLGFLLITFFVFTTSLSKPTAMKLVMPDDRTKDSSLVAEGKTISLLLADNNIVYYYNGDSIKQMHITNYSAKGMRAVLQQKQELIRQEYTDASQMIVLVKPTEKASYMNIVNTLDEMKINAITHYALMDANAEETAMIR